VYGPNGFLRAFKGSIASSGRAQLNVRASYDTEANRIMLAFTNVGAQPVVLVIKNRYTGKTSQLRLGLDESMSKRWSLASSFGWYDLAIAVDDDPSFAYRFAGHLETDDDSMTDPLMGGLV
jgi:phospholipase C